MSVDRIGVSAAEKIINQMGLVFREQPTDDYGIDAQIETIENGYATYPGHGSAYFSGKYHHNADE